METDKKFVEMILKAIVGKPENVCVERSVDDMGVLITVTVDKSDMPVLIGAKGQNVNALRTLLRIVGSKHAERVNLKVIEPVNI